MVHTSVDTKPPSQRRFSVTTWEGNTGRLSMPMPLTEDAVVKIGGIGPGWLELTTAPTKAALPYTVTVGSEERLSVHLTDARTRLSFYPGEQVLVYDRPARDGSLIFVVAAECLELALREVLLRPPRLLMRPEWRQWRGEVLGDG